MRSDDKADMTGRRSRRASPEDTDAARSPVWEFGTVVLKLARCDSRRVVELALVEHPGHESGAPWHLILACMVGGRAEIFEDALILAASHLGDTMLGIGHV